jgi:hypothetical protein
MKAMTVTSLSRGTRQPTYRSRIHEDRRGAGLAWAGAVLPGRLYSTSHSVRACISRETPGAHHTDPAPPKWIHLRRGHRQWRGLGHLPWGTVPHRSGHERGGEGPVARLPVPGAARIRRPLGHDRVGRAAAPIRSADQHARRRD